MRKCRIVGLLCLVFMFSLCLLPVKAEAEDEVDAAIAYDGGNYFTVYAESGTIISYSEGKKMVETTPDEFNGYFDVYYFKVPKGMRLNGGERKVIAKFGDATTELKITFSKS